MQDVETLASLSGRPVTIVINKTDRLSQEQQDVLARAFSERVLVSALTGAGVDGLRSLLERVLVAEPPSAEATLVTSVRQQHAISRALALLMQAAYANLGRSMRRL